MWAWIVLLLSGGLVVYAYAGYPLLLRLLAQQRNLKNEPSKMLADVDCPSVVILICAFNESRRIVRKIDNCLAQDYPADKLHVLVISDGSDDDTEMLVKNYEHDNVSLISNPHRSGKAACINIGMAKVSEEIVVMADVRQRLSEQSVRALVSHFSDATVGAVTGELRLETPPSEVSEKSFGDGMSTYLRHEIELRRAESAVHSVVGVTGAIYALRKAAFEPIPRTTILDDVLIPMNIVMAGYFVKIESRACAFDIPSSDFTLEKHRKVRTLAGNFQLISLRPRLINPRRNPIFWLFVSHKLTRLFVPLAMVAAVASSIALAVANWAFSFIFFGQLAGYAISVLPEPVFAKISNGPFRLVRTFVQLHWFVVLGFIEFLVNRSPQLWRVSSPRN